MRFNASSSPEVGNNPLQFAPGVAVRATMEMTMPPEYEYAYATLRGTSFYNALRMQAEAVGGLDAIKNCGIAVYVKDGNTVIGIPRDFYLAAKVIGFFCFMNEWERESLKEIRAKAAAS